VAVVAVAGTSFQEVQQRLAADSAQQVAQCQARFNDDVARVTKIRGLLTDRDHAVTTALSNSTTTLITAVFTIKPDDPDGRAKAAAAFTAYRKAAAMYKAAEAQITAERREHPLPVLRPGTCT
jgi:hypothetical protein